MIDPDGPLDGIIIISKIFKISFDINKFVVLWNNNGSLGVLLDV